MFLQPKATSNLQYYCCFRRLHVKKGLLLITCHFLFAQIFELVIYITNKNSIKTSTHYIFELFEAVSAFSLIIALRTDRSIFLCPFLFLQFLTTIALLLLTLFCFVTVFIPSNPYRELFETDNKSLKDSGVRVRAFGSFVIYFLGDVYEIWAMSVVLACHRYFDDMEMMKAERKRRNRNPRSNCLPNDQTNTVNEKPTAEQSRRTVEHNISANNSQAFTNLAYMTQEIEDEIRQSPFDSLSNRQLA